MQLLFPEETDLASFDYYGCKNDVVYEMEGDFCLSDIKYGGREAIVVV